MIQTTIAILVGLALAAPVTGLSRSGWQQDSPAATAAVVPDTPAGRALREFVTSFNAGGAKRRAWVEERTTLDREVIEDVLKQDAGFLEQHGGMVVARIAEATAGSIVAIVRHEKTGAHGHLTVQVEPEAPHKVSSVQLRGATPEEIKGR